MQSFLNCYLRETGSGEWVSADEIGLGTKDKETVIYTKVDLPLQGVVIAAGVRYKSPTGRHVFAFPVYYRTGAGQKWVEADYVTLAVILVKELSLQLRAAETLEGTSTEAFPQAASGAASEGASEAALEAALEAASEAAPALETASAAEAPPVGVVTAAARHSAVDELILRLIQSTRNIESFVSSRQDDTEALYGFDTDFIEAEQSLLFGHLIHPTPKSRQGIPEEEQALYSPELKGEFQLHYFRAHRSIVREDSAWSESASELVKAGLRDDPSVPPAFMEDFCGSVHKQAGGGYPGEANGLTSEAGTDSASDAESPAADDYSLIPVHPLQARWLLTRPEVQRHMEAGLLQDMGQLGQPYAATSSLRTVYHPESRFMFKFSVQVKVTNSLRVNLFKELERGVEVQRLLLTDLGRVRNLFPGFDITCDPAYLTLRLGQEDESGFEVVLRDNQFRQTAASSEAQNATLVAGLVQDALPGQQTRIARIIRELSAREGRSTEEVSTDWFRRYLDISLRPMVWLYLTYGVALEAHQQNSVVQLKEGYPERFRYRDNQGYYFCRSTRPLLDNLLPGIGEKSQTVCEDAVADERFRYYLIYNHMFGLINGFGAAGLIDERVLLAELRAALEAFLPQDREPSVFLRSLLNSEKLPCKANLLTRLYDMDELVGAMDTQSIYCLVDNPLAKEAGRE
ncbi:IucA/IucC family siderophore biosynthesis protein [Paenibacillus sp. N10]|uniref:IucA/IucC family siderophore biosynthesis protein n=2 Tax=Paenibacillus lutrae TaxID=2078573 RepID=A0A7X3FLI6_9BACL|nr:IucA/IucC family siderophore biosynthesis protein [Paenibacillus lutrae]